MLVVVFDRGMHVFGLSSLGKSHLALLIASYVQTIPLLFRFASRPSSKYFNENDILLQSIMQRRSSPGMYENGHAGVVDEESRY